MTIKDGKQCKYCKRIYIGEGHNGVCTSDCYFRMMTNKEAEYYEKTLCGRRNKSYEEDNIKYLNSKTNKKPKIDKVKRINAFNKTITGKNTLGILLKRFTACRG